MQEIEQPTFWEQRYREGSDRWDLGRAAPPLVEFLKPPQSPAPGRVAVLGCGRGHEALLFAKHGFEVVGFDFAPAAISAARQLAQKHGVEATFLQRDIFDLTPEFAEHFDYVVEHTCFCAIPPTKRSQYVEVTHRLLRPRGELIGLFFTHSRPGGPPFGVTKQEIRQFFHPRFQEIALEITPNSVSSRQGEEHLGHFQKS
jgi:SAM-dependent methyltransferase